SCTPRPPWHCPAQAYAHRRTRTVGTRSQRLTPPFNQKCSANFSAKLLICQNRMVDSAQVGLAWTSRSVSNECPINGRAPGCAGAYEKRLTFNAVDRLLFGAKYPQGA